jgi:hypothetical protein
MGTDALPRITLPPTVLNFQMLTAKQAEGRERGSIRHINHGRAWEIIIRKQHLSSCIARNDCLLVVYYTESVFCFIYKERELPIH